MLDSDEKPSSAWQLSPLQIPSLRGPIEVRGGGLTIGRDPSNMLVLSTDRFPGVSAHHARITVDGEAIWAEDLSSKNGTFVAGEQIDRRALKNGDIIQFGAGGPRFAVLSAAGLEGTVSLARTALFGARTKSAIGEETVERVRVQLDLPDKIEVAKMIAGEERKSRSALVVASLVVLIAFVVVWRVVSQIEEESRASVDKLQRQAEDLQEKLILSRAQLEEHQGLWETRQAEFGDARESWEADRSGLIKERARLEETIQKFANEKEGEGADMSALQEQLIKTTKSLTLYDPVNLEQARLREVARINRAVVMVEAREVLMERSTGEILFMSEDEFGFADFNYDGLGEPLSKEASGSGFCLNDEGYLLTNAHVVFKEEDADVNFTVLADEMNFEVALELTVTFSGESVKREAVLVDWVRKGDQDLALLKIEPFSGMATIGKILLDSPEPTGGTEVFCIGFPLGRSVMQQGETVIASTFRGIVSRKVRSYLQVDAAIHPGASGGPVIDGTGNVVGVVTAIHPVDREGKASAIGYIIPIADAGALWPHE
jgi:S1-C subfamily serine protease